MSRPPKPAMSDVEYRDTSHMGARAAAWAISEARGGVTHLDRRVTHWWVLEQRKQRKETPPGRKPRPEPSPLPTYAAEGNPLGCDAQEPVPHSVAPAERFQVPAEERGSLTDSAGQVAGVQRTGPALPAGYQVVAKGGAA